MNCKECTIYAHTHRKREEKTKQIKNKQDSQSTNLLPEPQVKKQVIKESLIDYTILK